MATLTDTPQDPDSSSTHKQHNSDDTLEVRGPNNTFVSPEPGDNKRTRLRFGEKKMQEEEAVGDSKKLGTWDPSTIMPTRKEGKQRMERT